MITPGVQILTAKFICGENQSKNLFSVKTRTMNAGTRYRIVVMKRRRLYGLATICSAAALVAVFVAFYLR